MRPPSPRAEAKPVPATIEAFFPKKEERSSIKGQLAARMSVLGQKAPKPAESPGKASGAATKDCSAEKIESQLEQALEPKTAPAPKEVSSVEILTAKNKARAREAAEAKAKARQARQEKKKAEQIVRSCFPDLVD